MPVNVLTELLTEILLTSIALFIIIDPLGTIPIYLPILREMPADSRRRTIRTAIWVSLLVLVLFSTLGMKVLGLLDVGLDELRVGGGLMLLVPSVAGDVEGLFRALPGGVGVGGPNEEAGPRDPCLYA